jgi:hypothetical protein
MPRTGHQLNPLYNVWVGAKQRCYYPPHKDFRNYGGKGVELHAPWHDARTFMAEVEAEIGPKPPGHSLDRIDGTRHYEPGNIKWSTPTEQAANRRSTSWLTVDGERSPLFPALRRLGLSHLQACSAYCSLRDYALPLERALRRFGVDMTRVSDLYLAPKRANYGRKRKTT